MGDVAHHGTEGDDAGDVLAEGRVDELGGERLPRAGGLRAGEEPQVGTVLAGCRRTPERRVGPDQATGAVGIHLHLRPRVLVVEVQLRVDAENLLERAGGPQLRGRSGGRLSGVVPAVDGDHEHPLSQSLHGRPLCRYPHDTPLPPRRADALA